MLKQALLLAEKGLLPDSLIRFGIRQLLKKRLDEISNQDSEKSQDLKSAFLKSMDRIAYRFSSASCKQTAL